MMKFTDLHLNDKLLKGIEEAGFVTLMPVQQETLIHTLKGRDAYVQSQTGTGKTAAFLITIFQLSLDKDQGTNGTSGTTGTIGTTRRKKALIIAPTRELAHQIEKDAVSSNWLQYSGAAPGARRGYHRGHTRAVVGFSS